jgi:hypothetical protein
MADTTDDSEPEISEQREFTVSNWSDIDSVPELETRQKERIAHVLTEDVMDVVMWIPQWVYDDDDTDIETLSGSHTLLTGTIVDYSDAAWQVSQVDADTDTQSFFIPKSESYVFRSSGDDVESPQQKLGGF